MLPLIRIPQVGQFSIGDLQLRWVNYQPALTIKGRVYPRVRGGTDSADQPRDIRPGLSPRARGNRVTLTITSNVTGSIPACAGEPTPAVHRKCRKKVYPRVRGGTALAGRVNRSSQGLSPRARGNPIRTASALADTGSIPACAGEPRPRPSHDAICRVYPRVRGGTTIDGF